MAIRLSSRYSHSLLISLTGYTKTENGIEEKAMRVPTPEEKHEMREYNKYAEKYIRLCVDKIKMDSLRRNVVDSKNYNLTTNQIKLLGF